MEATISSERSRKTPPPKSESELSHSKSAAVPSRFWTAEALLPLWQSQLCWRRAPSPQRSSPTTKSSLHRDPRPAPHPRKQASLRRKARASSRTQEALRYQNASRVRKLSFRFGKASLLASRTTTPTLKPNHEKLPIPAIHAEHPPQEASFPPPQGESKLSHPRSPAVPKCFWTVEALLPLWESQLCWRRVPSPQRLPQDVLRRPWPPGYRHCSWWTLTSA